LGRGDKGGGKETSSKALPMARAKKNRQPERFMNLIENGRKKKKPL